MKKVVSIALILAFTGMLFVGCEEKPQPVSQENINLAVSQIKLQSGVRGAAIVQKDNELSLVIIVDYNVAEKQAKELGDNFVRLTKSFVDVNHASGEEIGTGIYDYLITVAYINEQIVAQGAVVSTATHITWHGIKFTV